MSIADLERFIQMAAEDAALRDKIAATPDAAGAVALAAEKGLTFTVEEAEQLTKVLNTPEGELSEADLAQVAGGIGTWPTPEMTRLKATFDQTLADKVDIGGFSW